MVVYYHKFLSIIILIITVILSFYFHFRFFCTFFLTFQLYFYCRENVDLTRIRDAEREVASSKWTSLIAAAAAKGVHLAA